MRPKNRPWKTAALGSGSWRTQSSRMSTCHGSLPRGTVRAVRASHRIPGSPAVSAIMIGVNAIAQPISAWSSTGISITIPRTRSGAGDGGLERHVGAQRRPEHDRLRLVEMVEQRDHLAPKAGIE